MQEKWLQWAIEIQAIAQAGLTYGRDAYDKERYVRLREIAAEMISSQTELPVEKVRGLFCNETGYQTPKVDTRAAVFQEDKILLVQEANGTWALPGGWCDVNCSVAENTVKETLEEAGLHVRAERLIAVQDRNRHNSSPYPYGVVKIFVLCTPLGGEFVPNIETTRRAFFAREALPAPLAEEKVTREQILLCFDAKNNPNWVTQFD